MLVLRHIGLRVPDLREAETHYARIFGADLVGREVERHGRWYSVPHDRSWNEILDAGLTIDWVGLRRDDLMIALFPGQPDPDRTLFCIGVRMSPDDVAEVRGRLPSSVTVERDRDDQLVFLDQYGFRWQCNDMDFRSIGDTDDQWLEI